MAKQPPPLDEKKLKISQGRIEDAWEDLRKHTLMGPLVMKARLRIIGYQPQIPNMFTTGSSSGEIFANPYNFPRSVPEWTYVLGHSLLHLAFGHFKKIGRGILWNIACDCVVNEFLNRMRIGSAPESMLRLPSGMPNDEEKLFTLWTQNGTPPKGETTNGTALDMVAGAQAKANWPDIFARAIRRSVTESLTSAAGETTALGQAQQARMWFVKQYPLLGAVLQHFKIVEDARLCERLQIRIAAIFPARRQLILNPGWAMDDAEYRYVMAHMAFHAGLLHHLRSKGRDPFIWSAACDFCINSWLSRIPFLSRMCKPPGEGLLLSAQYQDQTPDQIYDTLCENLKTTHKLITFAGEGVPDLLGMAVPESGDSAQAPPAAAATPKDSERVLLDSLLRGYQIHTESGKGTLPYSLIEDMRQLESPPLPWDVQLAKWFDANVPPIERIRTYARPSRRQSSTPQIARPRYVWPDEENVQRSTFGLVIDSSGGIKAPMMAMVLGAISAYALSRNIAKVRIQIAGSEPVDKGMVAADEIAQDLVLAPRTSALLRPALENLERARDFADEAPILFVTSSFCDRIQTPHTHAFLIPEGGRLPFKTDAAVIEIGT